MEDTTAKIFGVSDFPVCTPEQKVAIEEAYAKAVKAFTDGDRYSGNCMCDVIVDLLNGTASPAVQRVAARAVAQSLYEQKAALTALASQVAAAIKPPTVH